MKAVRHIFKFFDISGTERLLMLEAFFQASGASFYDLHAAIPLVAGKHRAEDAALKGKTTDTGTAMADPGGTQSRFSCQ